VGGEGVWRRSGPHSSSCREHAHECATIHRPRRHAEQSNFFFFTFLSFIVIFIFLFISYFIILTFISFLFIIIVSFFIYFSSFSLMLVFTSFTCRVCGRCGAGGGTGVGQRGSVRCGEP
jgi:hypothetical protein